MLTIHPINSLGYYSDLASEDYYHKGGEPPGLWGGIGARLLGLQGQIDVEDYGKVFTGFDPATNKALFDQSTGKHRAGWDCTLSCPKSFSVLWARANADLRKQLEYAQQSAAQTTIDYLQEIATTRRGHNGVEHEKVAGVLSASFDHCTSRALDMQCHTHLLLANCAPRQDGTWGTLESRYFYQHMKAGGAIFRNALAKELQAMGFAIERDNDNEGFFKVTGIDDALCKFYSKRSNVIRDIADELGINMASAEGKQITLKTREHKQKIDRAELFERWSTEMDERGFHQADAHALQQAPIQARTALPLHQIAEQLTDTKSVIHKADIMETVTIEATFHQQDVYAAKYAIEDMLKQGLIVELENDGKFAHMFTTPQMQAIEQQLLHEAVALQQETRYQLPSEAVLAAIDQQTSNQGFALSDEQTEAVLHISKTSFDILQGSAGAGKSTSLGALKLAYQQAGVEVIGACTAKQAANQLQAETSIPSFTVAKLLSNIEQGRQSLESTVLVIDEAGQVSSRDLQQLTQLATEAHAKLVLVGEDKQMQAIQNPGALGYLASVLGCSQIETIRRQHEAYQREAVMQMRDGNTLEALSTFDQHDLIHWCEDQDHAVNQLVTHWHRYQQTQPDKRSLIIANTWAEVQAISDRVRLLRQLEGHVSDENITLECSVSDKQREFCYSVGDRIKLTKNDHRLQFDNGTFGTIAAIEDKGNDQYCFTINTDDKRTLHVHTDSYCDEKGRPYMALAYALTTYASQGSTVDETFILHNSQMNRAASYVASSRHRDHCHLFVDSDNIEAHMYLDDGESITAQKRLKTLAEMMARDEHPRTTLHYSHEQNLELVNSVSMQKDKSLEMAL
ncbi:MAG: MobF family relaxase [Candidatus Thiodiazotropha sp. 4PDIV1]